jgi:hypothetical protein
MRSAGREEPGVLFRHVCLLSPFSFLPTPRCTAGWKSCQPAINIATAPTGPLVHLILAAHLLYPSIDDVGLDLAAQVPKGQVLDKLPGERSGEHKGEG